MTAAVVEGNIVNPTGVDDEDLVVAGNWNRAFEAGMIELYHEACLLEGGLRKRGAIPALRRELAGFLRYRYSP